MEVDFSCIHIFRSFQQFEETEVLNDGVLN